MLLYVDLHNISYHGNRVVSNKVYCLDICWHFLSLVPLCPAPTRCTELVMKEAHTVVVAVPCYSRVWPSISRKGNMSVSVLFARLKTKWSVKKKKAKKLQRLFHSCSVSDDPSLCWPPRTVFRACGINLTVKQTTCPPPWSPPNRSLGKENYIPC